MLDLLSSKPFQNKSGFNSTLIPLWLFKKKNDFKPITAKELEWAKALPHNRSEEYKYSRGYLRDALASMWKIPALEIPLTAPPGEAPQLSKGWGYISLSHCQDALAICWSIEPIGVDIESKNRKINTQHLRNRYFPSVKEKLRDDENYLSLNSILLRQWVCKEAAIKWQRGKLFVDFAQWKLSKDNQLAFHTKLNLKVCMHNLDYKSWEIAIASNYNIHTSNIIICQT